jgi:hypothetical protein
VSAPRDTEITEKNGPYDGKKGQKNPKMQEFGTAGTEKSWDAENRGNFYLTVLVKYYYFCKKWRRIYSRRTYMNKAFMLLIVRRMPMSLVVVQGADAALMNPVAGERNTWRNTISRRTRNAGKGGKI